MKTQMQLTLGLLLAGQLSLANNLTAVKPKLQEQNGKLKISSELKLANEISSVQAGLKSKLDSGNMKNTDNSAKPLFKFKNETIKLQSGGTDRGGGDAEVMIDLGKRTEIENSVKKLSDKITSKVNANSFKNELIAAVNSDGFRQALEMYSSYYNNEVAKTFDRLKDQGLLEDIQQTDYVLSDECYETLNKTKVRKFLSTEIGKIGAPICVDPKNFAVSYLKYDTYKNQILFPAWMIVGLLFHDHARHFGVMDEDHTFAMTVAEAYFYFMGQSIGESSIVKNYPVKKELVGQSIQVFHHSGMSFMYMTIKLDSNSECAKEEGTLKITGQSDMNYLFDKNASIQIEIADPIFTKNRETGLQPKVGVQDYRCRKEKSSGVLSSSEEKYYSMKGSEVSLWKYVYNSKTKESESVLVQKFKLEQDWLQLDFKRVEYSGKVSSVSKRPTKPEVED